MKKYTKIIVLSLVLVAIIACITLAMIFDVDFILFKNLSITGIQEKKLAVESLIAKQVMEEATNISQKTKLQTSKNNFDVAKQEYENIDKSTIEVVQEATTEERYFIEYLWIVLGNYASTNNVAIDVHTSGDTLKVETQEGANDAGDGTDASTQKTQNSNSTTNTVMQNIQNSQATTNSSEDAQWSDGSSTSTNQSGAQVVNTGNGIKLVVQGRYADVADFVFDVENDKSLKFKLDNIKMTYSGDNKIIATFDILSLAVLK